MKKKIYLFFIFLCSFSIPASSQIQVAVNTDGAQLAEIMTGPGVTISNVVRTCPDSASGTFNCIHCNLGLDSGIVLTNGWVSNVPGPNNDSTVTGFDDWPWGDTDLANLIGLPVTQLFQSCALEFDVTALSDSIQFKYVFGSDEYPNYVCSQFNDAFAFFISGPGIAGLKDIALVPGTTIPVAINSINDGDTGLYALGGRCNQANQSLSYSQYYVNNGDGTDAYPNNYTNPYYIQYNGFTVPLIAGVGGLQPCQKYHLKLVIADVMDSFVDSGVFIEANSLTGNVVTIDSVGTTVPGQRNAVRGCVDGLFDFRFPNPVSSNTYVQFKIKGTATNGVDYVTIPDSLEFLAGENTAQLLIKPIGASASDTETVTIYLYTACDTTVPYDSATLLILDSVKLQVGPAASICPGGSVQLFASDTSLFTTISNTDYTWTPAAGLSNTQSPQPIASPMITTNYKCTLTVGTCQASDTVTISVYNPAPFSVNAGSDILNCTSNTTQLNAVVTGNPIIGHPFVYSWTPTTGLSNPAILNPTASVAGVTSYILQVVSSGCKASDTIKVTLDSIAASVSSTSPACSYGGTGSATVTTNGVNPDVFHWSNAATTATVNGLNSGTYDVTVTDHLSCTITASATIVIPPAIHFSTPVISEVSCFGGNNGTATIAASGGTGAISYDWSSGSTSSTAPNLSATAYTVTATDAKLCTADTSISITAPALLTVSLTPSNVSCFGGSNGSVTAVVAGGTAPYSYKWSDTSAAPIAITGLDSDSYELTVTDENSCTATATTTVSQPSALVLSTTVTNASCFGRNDGAIQLTASGGTLPYTYDWGSGITAQNPGNLLAGTYALTLTDHNGCTANTTAIVAQPQSIYFNMPTIINVTCFAGTNGSITITASNGTSPFGYAWSSGSTDSITSGVSAGAYTVTATDAHTCSADTSIVVTSPPQLVVSLDSTGASCFGDSTGSASAQVSGGVSPYAYNWNNGDITSSIQNLAEGNYAVTVTDHALCTVSSTIQVTQPNALSISAGFTNVSCFDGNNGTVTMTAGGGTAPYNYAWNTGASTPVTLTGLDSGTYTVTVTDVHTCSDTASATITQPNALVFGAPVVVNELCNGASAGSITVSISGGVSPYSYSWSQNQQLNSPVASALPAATYLVTATDANHCSLSQSNTITAPSAIVFETPTDTNVSCFSGDDGSALVSVTGGVGDYIYTWNGTVGGDWEENLTAGSYTVVVTDSNQCTASIEVVITSPPALTATATTTATSCFGSNNGSATVAAGGGNPAYKYLWSDGQTNVTATLLSANTYNCTVTDSKACSITTSATVMQPSQLAISITDSAVKCVGALNGSIVITASGATPPYSYAVTQNGINITSSSTGIISGLATGSYIVSVSDNNQCAVTDTTLVPNALPDFYTIVADSISCYGAQYASGTILVNDTVSENAPVEYAIDGGSLQDSGDFTNLAAGVHQLTIVDGNGCTTDTSATIGEPVQGIPEILPSDTTIQLGESIQLVSHLSPYSSSSIVSWNWFPTTGLSCSNCPAPVVMSYAHINDYTLTIIYNNSCVATASAQVIVRGNPPVFIPNSFSPNGDGINDVFLIYGDDIKTISLKIFNRWGEKVFESNSQFQGWDGTFKGVLQDPAVFVYEAQITFLDNSQTLRTGSITLIR